MPIEITLIKRHDGLFSPATGPDQESCGKYRVGQPVRFSATKLKPRSLDHHRMYWGGLLELTSHYWQPRGGLIAESEIETLRKYAKWLDAKAGNTGAVQVSCKQFLDELSQSRSDNIQLQEKSIEALHVWVKEKAGYYDLIQTPGGLKKHVKSINFNAMDQDEFNAFYKKAFSVCWDFVLSRTFGSEQEAENAINQLLSMG